MALSSLLSLSLSLLSLTADARPSIHLHPYKTVLMSYTISSSPSSSSSSNPTIELSEISTFSNQNPTTGVFTVYRFFRPTRRFYPFPDAARPIRIQVRPHLPRAPAFHEPAQDIIAVVAGIVFGVLCGVLMSATMILVWYMTAHPREVYGSKGYGDESDEEDEGLSPKKMGYVMMEDARR